MKGLTGKKSPTKDTKSSPAIVYARDEAHEQELKLIRGRKKYEIILDPSKFV